jgi:hypothetical protein
MATLAADQPRVYGDGVEAIWNEIDAIASDIIYEGAAVGESSSTGTGRPCVAGDVFLGFAHEQCDNSSGSAGDKRIKVRQTGVVKIAITGVVGVADVGDDVYASDDNTFTLTAGSNTWVGNVHRYLSGTTCEVWFRAKTLIDSF